MKVRFDLKVHSLKNLISGHFNYNTLIFVGYIEDLKLRQPNYHHSILILLSFGHYYDGMRT